MKVFSVCVLLIALAVAVAVAQREDNRGWDSAPPYVGGQCSLWGDPHITTYDGVFYDYQDEGWHWLVINEQMAIDAYFYDWGNGAKAVQQIRVYVWGPDGTILTLRSIISESKDTHKDSKYLGQWAQRNMYVATLFQGQDLNMVPDFDNDDGKYSYKDIVAQNTYVTLPGTAMIVRYQMSEMGYTLTVKIPYAGYGFADDADWAAGLVNVSDIYNPTPRTRRTSERSVNVDGPLRKEFSKVVFSPRTFVYRPAYSMIGKTCGICGTFDADQSNDFTKYEQDVLTLNGNSIYEFGNSWRSTGVPTMSCVPNHNPSTTSVAASTTAGVTTTAATTTGATTTAATTTAATTTAASTTAASTTAAVTTNAASTTASSTTAATTTAATTTAASTTAATTTAATTTAASTTAAVAGTTAAASYASTSTTASSTTAATTTAASTTAASTTAASTTAATTTAAATTSAASTTGAATTAAASTSAASTTGATTAAASTSAASTAAVSTSSASTAASSTAAATTAASTTAHSSTAAVTSTAAATTAAAAAATTGSRPTGGSGSTTSFASSGSTSGQRVTTGSSSTTGGDYIDNGNNTQNGTAVTNNTIIDFINSFQNTPQFTEAQTACDNAGVPRNSLRYTNCMYDVLSGNNTAAANDGPASIVSNCALDDGVTLQDCFKGTPYECPRGCNGNGKCVNGKCDCEFGYTGDSCVKTGLNAAELAGVVSAGTVAAIAIGAAVFVALTGFGAKKGYDYLKNRDNNMGGVSSNPLYQEKKAGGTNPLYDTKA